MPLNPSDLREICWNIGTRFPSALHGDFISFIPVHSRQAFLLWHVGQEAIDRFIAGCGGEQHGSRPIVRVYDVTDIIFDGANAHSSFDIEVAALSGNYYLELGMQNRNLVAEIGLRLCNGNYHSFARSNVLAVDRDRRAASSSTRGLFVGTDFSRVFSVENVFEAASLAPLNRLLAKRRKPLRVASVSISLEQPWPLDAYAAQILKDASAFGIAGETIYAGPDDLNEKFRRRMLVRRAQACASVAFGRLFAAHAQAPFSVVHCHDWYSWLAARALQQRNGVALLLSLHSTEIQRAGGEPSSALSRRIFLWERHAARTADRVAAASESVRDIVLRRYGIDQRAVTVIPDAIPAAFGEASAGTETKGTLRLLGISYEGPVVLYCGEISHANGADLLMAAIPRVCAEHGAVQFVFAGDGPLRGELETQAFHAGLGQRCRFCGHVSTAVFEALLDRCDIVVIPARTWQDETLAQQAIKRGRPVLTTHQAQIACVSHGRNGLVAYDNPGSIEWGLKEMLFGPQRGGLLRFFAGRTAVESPSREAIAALHAVAYHELAMQAGGMHA